MKFISEGEENTEKLGEKFARELKSGDGVYIYGGLGAGKTAFVRGMARGMGLKNRVTSPTYAIVNEYLDGELPLFHFDLFRLEGENDLFNIGFDEYAERYGVTVCEWSENLCERPPPGAYVVVIEKKTENTRDITITGGRKA